MFETQHKHKWSYMFSSSDNEHQWYYCTECLAQAVTTLDTANSKVKTPQIFEVTQPLTQKKKSKW